MLLVITTTCTAANHYKLLGWRNWSGPENGQAGPGYIGNAFMRIFVLDESGQPVKDTRVWFDGLYYGSQKISWQLTDDRGHVEYGFQFSGNPCKVWISDNVDGASSTTDITPEFYNHDNHRVYDIYFVKTGGNFGWTADTGYCGNLLDMNTCPSTASFHMNTPICSTYYSGFRGLAPGNIQSFGQTFVANADRAMIMRAHLTKGGGTIWRWSAQIFEGGPDGPPMGPKKNLKHNYISDDIKYFLSYGTEECALKPGNTYYVKFTAADGSDINGYRCVSDVYNNGLLYENGSPVSTMDLQCQVLGMSSGNSNVGTVAGTVRNAAGQPVNEATITLAPGNKTILTGQLGTYKCYNVAPGTYSYTVTAPGYEAKTVTNRIVAVGSTLTTDIVLDKTAGPIRVVSTTGASIEPGDTNIPMAMTVASTSGGDCFVNFATLTFWNGSSNNSGYFTVKPNGSNPTVIRGNTTATFNFLVDCAAGTPGASYTVQGSVDANVNLQANGSFEADDYLPNYTGPTGWDWNSDDAPSVARLSYQHEVVYESPSGWIPLDSTSGRLRWIGAWSDGGSAKQGFKLYIPKVGVTNGLWRIRFDIRFSDDTMQFANGTPDVAGWKYPFTPGSYYQLDANINGTTGRFQVDVTPLQNQGSPVTITGQAESSTGGPKIEWGKMYSSGTWEMSCREIHYWFEGPNPTERHWLAINGMVPSDKSGTVAGCGWNISGGSGIRESMLPGAPWSADTHFEISTLDKKEGSKCLRVMCSPSDAANSINLSTGSAGWLSQYNRMQVKPMTTYKLSFWYKQTQYTVNPANLRVLWEEYDSLGNRYYYEPSSVIGYRPPFHWDEREPVSHGEWRYKTYTFTTGPAAATAEVLLRMDKPSNDSVADVFCIDDFRFMELNSYADLTADNPGTLVVNAPVPVDSIAEAKDMPDGTSVLISDVIVAGTPASEPNVFYVEESDRSSGIRVDNSAGLIVTEDNEIDITGTLSTVNGERVLTSPSVSGQTSSSGVAPLGVQIKSLGGASNGYTPGVEAGVGLNNIGLLVTIAGQINNAGSGYLYADDGSGLSDGAGTGVKVMLGGIPMQSGKTFVTVTGFSSVENINGTYYRVIKPRYAGDIVWY